MNRILAAVAATCLAGSAWTTAGFGDEPVPTAQGVEKKGVFADPNYFPLAVWLQSPRNAAQYHAIGINTYVAISGGVNAETLAELKRNDIKLVCSQGREGRGGLAMKDDPTIIAWMHGDEPDNAQSIRGQRGQYGPPVATEKIVEDYQQLKKNDPTRPVLLNLGQGVAWDNYVGRGVRRNHPEDYPEYIKGCDIASFDIYPACHSHAEVAGKLWFVADGVTRLKKWSNARQQAWNCIETTHINNPDAKATPHEVKAEVWMSIVRGSQGIIYFVHEFRPASVSTRILSDPEMSAGVAAINKQIHELAPVINSPSISEVLAIESSSAEVPVEAVLKRHNGDSYVFAVCMRDGQTTARFKIAGVDGKARAEVLGEDRSIDVQGGTFSDEFKPWDVHLYRIRKE